MDYRLSAILSRYGGEKDGDGLRIPCPVHHGENNNCAVWIDDKDKIGAVCHSQGCAVTEYLWKEFDAGPKRGPVSKEQKEKAVWLPNSQADVFNAPRQFKDKRGNLYSYTSQYQYFSADGVPINLVVVRFDDQATGAKNTIPYIWVQLDDGRKLWIARAPHEPQWYGLQTLAPRDTILIVEGEKTANAAWKVVNERMGVLTWLGGSGKHARLDLSILKGKKVILWPDYDDPGFKWAWRGENNFYDQLKKLGVDVSIIMWDGGPGSDAADVKSPDAMWDIIRTAGPVDEFRLSTLYAECIVAVAIGMTEEQSKKIACGSMAQCVDCKYKYIPDIVYPNQLLNLDPVLHDYAYIASEEAFVNLTTLQTYSQSGLNNICASLPGYSLDNRSKASKQFLEHPGTLRVHEREFRPGAPLIVDNKINLARTLEWEMQDEEPDLWLRMGAHLFKDHELKHILDWLAFTVQNPAEKIEHTLLVVGEQGAGKSLFFHPVEKAFQRVGQHQTVNSNQLMGNFNDFLVNTKLLTMEELNFAGAGFSGSNKLKEWQAAPPNYITINPKFAKPFNIPNIVNIIAYSNFDLPAKLETNQRRWYVVKTEVGRLEDLDWYDYDTFNNMLSDHYIDKVLSFLKRRDISQFKRGNAPRTDAGEAMELMSIAGYRELAPTIQEIEWAELVDLREVKIRLEFELGRIPQLNDTSLRKILRACGWVNLEVCMKVNGKSIRPWATVRGEMYKQAGTGDLVAMWKKRSADSPHSHHQLSEI